MINGSSNRKNNSGVNVGIVTSEVRKKIKPIKMPSMIRKQDSGNTDLIPGNMWKTTLPTDDRNIQRQKMMGPLVCSNSK